MATKLLGYTRVDAESRSLTIECMNVPGASAYRGAAHRRDVRDVRRSGAPRHAPDATLALIYEGRNEL